MTGMLERRRISRRAGASAARMYEERLKAWRRRNRKYFVTLTVVVFLVVVATEIPARHHIWVWLGGVLSGGLVAFLVAVRESPPTWIENYQVGAWGEERTAKALAPLLKRGWVVLHDLNRFKSNLDHVIVGPAGVFVLDTKNLSGTTAVSGDTLTVTHPDGRRGYSDDGYARGARRQGWDLNQLLKQRCNIRVWVTAVVVLWPEFPQQAVTGDRVTFVHGDHLVDWLSHQPARLSAAQVAQIAAALQPGQRRRPNQQTESTPV